MKINWHRLFGLMLMDYFSDRGFRVELEKDLSQKRQYLDVVIIERKDEEANLSGICDGFDNLSSHNLLSYKSKRQSLNAWALEELIGHYVNYRKILDGSRQTKNDDIRLYAISTRWPGALLSLTSATEVKPGVWDIRVLSLDIRVLVLSRLPLAQRNAVLAFFSFNAEKVQFAMEHYHLRMEDGSTVINQLLNNYSLEGIAMPYTMEQFRKDYVKAHLPELNPDEVLSMFTPEDRLKGLAAKDRLKGLAPEDRLEGLAPKDRLKGLAPEDRLEGLAPKDRLKGLAPEEIEAYLKKLKMKTVH
jgi:hypothetical protein